MAGVYHIVTDMGNGAAYCDGCNAHLTSDPSKVPEICPHCKEPLSRISNESMYINSGGSDF